MTVDRGERRHRRRLGVLVACGGVLATGLLAIFVNLATSAVPAWWTDRYAVFTGAAVGVLLLVTAGFAVWTAWLAPGEPVVPAPPVPGTTGSLKIFTAPFVGRAAQIRRIDEAIAAAGGPRRFRGLYVLHGIAGIGKTMLASHIATRVVTEYNRRPDAAGLPALAHHVELGGREDPREAIREAFPRGGPVDAAKLAASELQGRWREYAAGRFLVLVLDNAGDEREVEPFLDAGEGHLVLVTSQRPLRDLEIKGAIPLAVPALEPAEAAALIRARVGGPLRGDEPAAAAAIAKACEYHPLAIRVAVAGLPKSAKALAERLARLPRRAGSTDQFIIGERGPVAQAFELAYLRLPAGCRLLLRRLGAAPVRAVGAELAGVLIGAGPEAAGQDLRTIEAEGLIEEDGPRYRMHELIRQYAGGLADADDAAAVERMLAYCVVAAAQADVVLTRQPPPPALPPLEQAAGPAFATPAAAVEWARAELANLQACALAPRTGPARVWTVRFATALAGLLRNDGLWTVSIELQGRAAAAAEELGNPLARANALHERGQLHRLVGKRAEAADDLTRALSAYRAIGGDAGAAGEAHALNTYGVVLDQAGRADESRALFAEAIAGYRRLGDRHTGGLGEANVLHDMGMMEFFAKDDAAAGDLLRQALARYQEIGHPLGQAHAHAALARLHRRAGDAGAASGHLQATQELYAGLGNRLGQASTLAELGTLLRPRADDPSAPGRDPERARTALGQAESIFHAIGNQIGRAGALTELGALHGATGDLARAEELLRQAWRIYRAAGVARDEERPLAELRLLGLPAPG